MTLFAAGMQLSCLSSSSVSLAAWLFTEASEARILSLPYPYLKMGIHSTLTTIERRRLLPFPDPVKSIVDVMVTTEQCGIR